MNKNNQKNSKFYKKPLVALLFVVCVLLLGFVMYSLINNNSLDANTETSTINYGPATNEEKQASEDNKSRLVKDLGQQPPEQTNNQKTSVSPVFGYIEVKNGIVKANGFISNIIEEGGVCTFTLKKEDQSIIATSTSLPDAQSTVCGLMQTSTGQISTGNWTATLSYNSNKYQGISVERLITIE